MLQHNQAGVRRTSEDRDWNDRNFWAISWWLSEAKAIGWGLYPKSSSQKYPPVPHLLSSVLPSCSEKKLPVKNEMYLSAALLLNLVLKRPCLTLRSTSTPGAAVPSLCIEVPGSQLHLSCRLENSVWNTLLCFKKKADQKTILTSEATAISPHNFSHWTPAPCRNDVCLLAMEDLTLPEGRYQTRAAQWQFLQHLLLSYKSLLLMDTCSLSKEKLSRKVTF